MPGFGGILSIARGALTTSQAAVQIASHNIANANTPGYSRQREVLTEGTPENSTLGIFGTGVTFVTVQRKRDLMLDQEYRLSNGQMGASSMRSEFLQRVENILAEPSDTGLANAFDQFYNAWSELSADPTNPSARTAVQQAGAMLTRSFNGIASQLSGLKAEAVERAQAAVSDVNRIANEVAVLNGRIVAMESSGGTASDLRDQRDQLLDSLSKTAGLRVIERTDGSTQVMLGTISLVDGISAKQVEMTSAGNIGFKIVGSPDSIRSMGGELGALQAVYNDDILDVETRLDTLAGALITDVNALHRTGWSPTAGAAGNWNPLLGATGSNVDFFDATAGNNTAARIRLSAVVDANAGAIAAGTAFNEPGNNALALSLAGLRESAPSAGNLNYSADYRLVVGDVAGALNEANNSGLVYETLVSQSDQRRTAVFGVSVDEELIQIMRQQQAYAAASKIIKTVDEMMQTLLSLK
ncbi:MAG: flagellar hook-associated protein FlgK [Gemmatimonadota bacterium]|nr:flagellar hook-associated protein FlgK [Gemmatimonadota bacterium]